MSPSPRFLTSLLVASSLLLVACATTVEGPRPVADAGPASDAATPTDATPADAGNPACAPPAPLPMPEACAGLTELATPAQAVRGSPDTYAMADLRPTSNRHRAACTREPWQDRSDARVRFTAPVGGRWRLTATGDELWALDVQRGCGASMACAGFADYHGPHTTSALTVDVQLQRGESTALVLDGCPEGTACRYALRAQRVADLACEFVVGTLDPCVATRQACSIDACDRQRFRCVDAASVRPRLASVRVLSDAAQRRAIILGRAEPPAPGTTPPRVTHTSALMARWLDASGRPVVGPTGAYVGVVPMNGTEFATQFSGTIPATAARGVFWFYDDAPIENHPGVEGVIEAWAPRNLGESCHRERFAERCAMGLRCVTSGGASGLCRVSESVELTRVRAWRDPVAEALRVAIEGEGVGAHVQEFEVTLLDASGATLARVPRAVTVTTHEYPSYVPFAAHLELSNAGPRPPGVDATFRLPPNVARVRLVGYDQRGRASAPVEVPAVEVAAAALGAPCDDPGVGCAAGLACERASGVGVSRCAPRVAPRACGLRAEIPTWAPPGAGATFTLTGAAHGAGGVTRCYGGRTQRSAVVEFVAPAAGAYVFEQRGLRAIEVGRGCTAGEDTSACALAPVGAPSSRVEVTLTAGERVPITVLSDADSAANTAFTLAAQVPR